VSAPLHGLGAVLIDLDGTLLDTVDVWHAAYVRLSTELGVTLDADFWPEVAGRSMADSLTVFGPAAPADRSEHLVARLVELAVTDLDHDPPGWHWLPGAQELVALVGPDGRKVPAPATALVTSAWRAFTLPLLGRALGDADVERTFDALVCGDDVTHGKPSPESYLRAAALLEVDPAACLVIEDSPTGVAAAEAAGMVVLAVPHAGPIASAPGRAVRDDLRGLTLGDLGALHARLRSGALA